MIIAHTRPRDQLVLIIELAQNENKSFHTPKIQKKLKDFALDFIKHKSFISESDYLHTFINDITEYIKHTC